MTSHDKDRQAAWRELERSENSLDVLLSVGSRGLRDVSDGSERTNLVRLLDMADSIVSTLPPSTKHQHSGSGNSSQVMRLGKILDLLASMDGDDVYVKSSLRRVVKLYVTWNLYAKERKRTLSYSDKMSRIIVKSLISICLDLDSGMSDRETLFEVTRELAVPYLSALDSSDPLYLFYKANEQSATSPPEEETIPDHLPSSTEALNQVRPGSTSIRKDIEKQYTVSSQGLLQIIAPSLLATLQKAPRPPLGISSTWRSQTEDGGMMASSFGGKVYSQQEFRERGEGLPSGLGSSSATGVASYTHTYGHDVGRGYRDTQRNMGGGYVLPMSQNGQRHEQIGYGYEQMMGIPYGGYGHYPVQYFPFGMMNQGPTMGQGGIGQPNMYYQEAYSQMPGWDGTSPMSTETSYESGIGRAASRHVDEYGR